MLFLARRVAGEEECESLADEVVEWVSHELGDGYDWPGNVRELEQCVRNVMIRGAYRPRRSEGSEIDALFAGMESAEVSMEELEAFYVTMAYRKIGSYQATARRLGLDRRTVKKKIDLGLLARLEGAK